MACTDLYADLLQKCADLYRLCIQICTNLHCMQVTKADGRKIRALREAADLTVDELVTVLDKRENLRRHPDTIRNFELGYKQPGFKLLNAIARVLEVPREALLADEDAAEERAS